MGRLQKKKSATEKNKQKLKQQQIPSEADTTVSQVKVVPKKQISKKEAAAIASQEPGLIEKCRTFLREVNAELGKVVWPSRNQTFASTAVVIVLVIIVSSFLGLFDVGLKGLIRMVLH